MAKPNAKPEPTEVVKASTAVLTERPTWMKKGGTAGRENITAEDILLPRLEIVQSLSPAMDETKAEYVEGAKAGDLINSVTREILPRPVMFVPVLFIKQFNIWKLRKFGGGFMGSYESIGDAQAELALRVPSVGEHDQYEILDTPVYYGLYIDDSEETPRILRISIAMAKTKAKHARRLSSLIDLTGEDAYNRVYAIGTVNDKSPKGEFKNFTIEQLGYPSEQIVLAAESFYKMIKSGGVKVKVNMTGAGTGDTDEM